MTTTSSSWLRMTDRCFETNSDSCNLMNKYQQQQCSFSVLWLNIWTKWTMPCSLQQNHPVCHSPEQCTILWQLPAVLSCLLAQSAVILLERRRSAAQIALRQQDQSRGCAQQTFLRLWSAVLLQTKLLWYLKKMRWIDLNCSVLWTWVIDLDGISCWTKEQSVKYFIHETNTSNLDAHKHSPVSPIHVSVSFTPSSESSTPRL